MRQVHTNATTPIDDHGAAPGFAKYIAERDFAALTGAISSRQNTHGDAIEHFRRGVNEFLQRGVCEPLRWLDERMPTDTALSFFTHLAMAFVAAWNGDVDETSRRLRETVRVGLAGQGVLGTDPAYRQYVVAAAQQALYIDHTYRLCADAIRDLPEITPAPSRRTLTILASCNGRYFERFGSGFIASVKKFLSEAAIHIHISNPDGGARQLMELLAANEAVTFSVDTTPDEACLFACKRFLIAPEVMCVRQSDLLISDIDVEFTDRIKSLTGLMADHDGGLFERDNVSPMEICHCSLSYFRHTTNALQFLSVLGSYIESKLQTDDLRMWMLDQCALFLVSRRAMRGELASMWTGDRSFSWANLTQVSGCELSIFQTNQPVDSAGKRELRSWKGRGVKSLEIRPDGSIGVH
jgi:hypothetical protein